MHPPTCSDPASPVTIGVAHCCSHATHAQQRPRTPPLGTPPRPWCAGPSGGGLPVLTPPVLGVAPDVSQAHVAPVVGKFGCDVGWDQVVHGAGTWASVVGQ